MGDLASIVKAYDIRGVVPDQLDEGVAEAVGAAFGKLTGATTIVTLHDMRASSGPLADRPGVSTDELDGLTVSAATWWFNLRPSNTEPLLRLNAEADTGAAMAAVRDEVLGLVRGTTDRSDN
jgi:phosphomannomutase